MKIVIYDAMSALRVKMESENPKFFLRGVLNETQLPGLRVWVWDGKGGNAARQKIFPPYKTSREHKPGAIRSMDFVRELIALTPSWQIRMNDVEGDDVVCALVDYFLATTDLNIEIHCRDIDLLANLVNPRVTCPTFKADCPPHLIRLRKLCVGKGSDDVPGIKGFGKGGWEKADLAGLGLLVERILAREPWTEAEALSVGLSKTSINWLLASENVDQLGAMRRVIAPLPITTDALGAALTQGRADPAALEAKLQEYLL